MKLIFFLQTILRRAENTLFNKTNPYLKLKILANLDRKKKMQTFNIINLRHSILYMLLM